MGIQKSEPSERRSLQPAHGTEIGVRSLRGDRKKIDEQRGTTINNVHYASAFIVRLNTVITKKHELWGVCFLIL